MTRITFLHGAQDRLQAVATWLARAGRKAGPVLVYVPSNERCEELDRMLWVTPATGFTPHCRADSNLAGETPIVFTAELDKPLHDTCLMNLSDEIPPGFSRFQHLVEIVSVDAGDRLRGRERFRFYRERGYPLEARDFAAEGY
jgi:DNA polymerase-3 subunit chi